MNRYRVELLGAVPNGTSHNEVFATVNSLLREHVGVESVTKRRLAGGTSGMVSIIAVFESDNSKTAEAEAVYAGRAVPNFSFDVMVRKCV